jgi:hypothetical protein
MHSRLIATLAAFSLLLTFAVSGGTAQAQSIDFSVRNIALKSGESTELGDVFFITHNCKSMLKDTPQVEILDGPPGVTAVINPAKIVPRSYSCASPISGGKLIITAKDIQEHSHTRMVLRLNYKTFSGDRQRSEHVNITLFPTN